MWYVLLSSLRQWAHRHLCAAATWRFCASVRVRTIGILCERRFVTLTITIFLSKKIERVRDFPLKVNGQQGVLCPMLPDVLPIVLPIVLDQVRSAQSAYSSGNTDVKRNKDDAIELFVMIVRLRRVSQWCVDGDEVLQLLQIVLTMMMGKGGDHTLLSSTDATCTPSIKDAIGITDKVCTECCCALNDLKYRCKTTTASSGVNYEYKLCDKCLKYGPRRLVNKDQIGREIKSLKWQPKPRKSDEWAKCVQPVHRPNDTKNKKVWPADDIAEWLRNLAPHLRTDAELESLRAFAMGTPPVD